MSDHQLRAEDTGAPLLDNDGLPITELDPDSADALADSGATLAEFAAEQRSWRYGHVIVDEAQDLTAMQWRMIARRARGGAMTVVGDLAQRAIGPAESWGDVIPPSIGAFDLAELTINYRSPIEINELATGVLAELAPGLVAPTAIRAASRTPVARYGADLDTAVAVTLAAERDRIEAGRIAVIGVELDTARLTSGADDDVSVLEPVEAKGLEFDSVIVVEPAAILDLDRGLSHLFVAVTRSTDVLTVVHHRPLPAVLGALDATDEAERSA